jgi:hypothetical protein
VSSVDPAHRLDQRSPVRIAVGVFELCEIAVECGVGVAACAARKGHRCTSSRVVVLVDESFEDAGA